MERMRRGIAGAITAAAILWSVAWAWGQASRPEGQAEPDVSIFPRAASPEPVIYALMRKLDSTPVGADRLSLRDLLRQWQALAHDGAVKAGGQWITAKELARRREAYTDALAEADVLLRQTQRLDPKDPKEQAEHARLQNQAMTALRAAAGMWGDLVIRNFLLGQAALLADSAAQAERFFSQCVDEQPLIAGFHQGRAMARDRQGRYLDALNDSVTAFCLRDDEDEAYLALEAALKQVPGGQITFPAFKQAKALLEEYNGPARRPAPSSSRGIRWSMPGGDWQGGPGSLPVPACDRFIARKTVAVPVTSDGILLCDAEAVAGAAEMLLEVARGRYVRAYPVKLRGPTAREMADAMSADMTPAGTRPAATRPAGGNATRSMRAGFGASASRPALLPDCLAAVRVAGYAFTPAELGKAMAIRPKDEVKVHVLSLPAEMDGAAPRVHTLRVVSVGADGEVKLDGQLRPGESAAPVFSSAGKLLTFLAGRTDAHAENGGPNVVLPPGEVAACYVAAGKAGASHYRPPRGSTVTPKQTDRPASGQVFTLHILAGLGGPEKKTPAY